MSTQGTNPAPGTKKSIGELVADISEKFSGLVRDEIKLAQTQLTEKVSKLGAGGGMLAAAGVLIALYSVPVLLYSAIHGLAHAVPLWLSALIIGLVLVLIAAIIGFIGYKKLQAAKEVTSPDPVGGMKKNIEAVKKGLHS
ncbi:hypothetical protein BSZ39_10930 [Bowdeniella nasicola]|uniref:Holin-X, holin superfamily III n=1 Tax=Bowdeniella nasicola TaxID=208480 RepID=A0A1Q5Q0F1_9ACTO|nr:phage holin family protein [Bowdeniella nasicola]OKL53175.1 hypothetical protein BSZ39_10930 [Bowdeniella nasicola]